jgi:hypothetical protein
MNKLLESLTAPLVIGLMSLTLTGVLFVLTTTVVTL